MAARTNSGFDFAIGGLVTIDCWSNVFVKIVGGGTVTGGPAGFACQYGACSGFAAVGSTVTLRFVPAVSGSPVQWSVAFPSTRPEILSEGIDYISFVIPAD